jgi:putative DNA methylase
MPPIRKKLIEVSIPLEAINKASAREKSIRHGHPSTLHLWWARRPLAACRAVLFSQLVDDPSSWPDRFPTEEDQDRERKRLHRIIEDMVPWEASNNEHILNAARWEIARSVAWGLGEEPPPKQDTQAILDYLQTKAPPVYDPFSGGGSIPLEAQRLGLRAYGSDLNPVAVLIGKALVEIPPRFADKPPVNAELLDELDRGGSWQGKGAEGLAEDVQFYGKWMREEAKKRIGAFYPNATLENGDDATVIAWLWARTVRSPDPAAKGAMVPLVSSFMLSRMVRNKAWVSIQIDENARDGWRFETGSGPIEKERETTLRNGNIGRSGGAVCALTGASIPFSYIRKEGLAGRLGQRLMAIVAEGPNGRAYLSPTDEHETIATKAVPNWTPDIPLSGKCRVNLALYGFDNFGDIFTARQSLALSTFSEIIPDLQAKVEKDAEAARMKRDGVALADGGAGARAYADAITTYLAFNITSMANSSSQVCTWDPGGVGWNTKVRNTFSRQALPMTWDYAEIGPFSGNTGSFDVNLGYLVKALAGLSNDVRPGSITMLDAAENSYPVRPVVVSTDPPYYDNIGYADLSDFFYCWLRPSLSNIWPDLFRRLATPKDVELVATPSRHGSKDEAETFFMLGMARALTAIGKASSPGEPITVYYAFKQSEMAEEGMSSPGWASFLQAVVGAGLSVDGTWPVRTESFGRLIGRDANALASSIVLVCRTIAQDASTITRADFVRLLKRELPYAIEEIRKAGVGPVDMQQSVIGPGMGVFSRHVRVLEDDDSGMSVKTALAIINRIWGEIENEGDATLDAETQVALAWFASYGFDAKSSGELITLANAKNIPTATLFKSDVFEDLGGRAGLKPRDKLSPDWTPDGDSSLTIWECVQHTARALGAEDGGDAAAARLIAQMGPKAADARSLAYRLFQIATDKGWAAEALVYNELAAEWPRLEALAEGIGSSTPQSPAKPQLDLL